MIAKKFVVLVKRAYRAGYYNIAVVELIEPGTMPKMISARAKNVKRIVLVYYRVWKGKTSKSSYFTLLKAAEKHCQELNDKEKNHAE